jgi:hypothetical protein
MFLAFTRSSRAKDLDLEITITAGIISGIGLVSGLDSETGSDLTSEICLAGLDSVLINSGTDSEISGFSSSTFGSFLISGSGVNGSFTGI